MTLWTSCKDWVTASTSPLEVCCDQHYFTLTEGPDSRRRHTSLTPLHPFIFPPPPTPLPAPPARALADWIKSRNDFKRSRFSFSNAVNNNNNNKNVAVSTSVELCVLCPCVSSCLKRRRNVNESRVQTWIGVGVFNMPAECLAIFLLHPPTPLLFRHCYSCICRRHSISTLFVLIEPIWLEPPSRRPLHNTWWQNTLPAPLLHLRWAHSIWMPLFCKLISSLELVIWAKAALLIYDPWIHESIIRRCQHF